MQWRVEKIGVDAQKVHERAERPLSYLSDEHLARLVDQLLSVLSQWPTG